MNKQQFDGILKERIEDWEQSAVPSFDREKVWGKVGRRQNSIKKIILFSVSLAAASLLLIPFLIDQPTLNKSSTLSSVNADKKKPAETTVFSLSKGMNNHVGIKRITQKIKSSARREATSPVISELASLDQNASVADVQEQAPELLREDEKQVEIIPEPVQVYFKPGRTPAAETGDAIISFKRGSTKTVLSAKVPVDTSIYISSFLKLRFKTTGQ